PGTNHGVRQGRPVAGEGGRRGRGGRALARGRRKAPHGPDATLDRSSTSSVFAEDAAGPVSAEPTGLDAIGRARSGRAPALLLRGSRRASGPVGRVGRARPRLASG